MTDPSTPSVRANRGLRKLGEDISIARKRRRFTQSRLAEGAGIHVSTVRRLESGDPGVSLGTLAMVLLGLGELDRLGRLMDMSCDEVGLSLSAADLPKRVRNPREKKRHAVRGVLEAVGEHGEGF